MPQQVHEVMTTDPVTLAPTSSVAEAARMMKQHDVGAIVIADGTVRGLVTDRDIVVRAVAEGRDGAQTSVGDICSGDVETVSPDEPVDRAVELMRNRSVRRVPVVDGEKVVGILSLGDLAMERDERSALADISAARPNR